MNIDQLEGYRAAQEVFIRFLWRELLHYSTDKPKTEKRARQAVKEVSEKNTALMAQKADAGSEPHTPEQRVMFLEGVERARERFLDIVSEDETRSDTSL